MLMSGAEAGVEGGTLIKLCCGGIEGGVGGLTASCGLCVHQELQVGPVRCQSVLSGSRFRRADHLRSRPQAA